MTENLLAGIALLVVGGLLGGAMASPVKLMRNYQYEHWALVSSVFGLLVLPWTASALLCPDLLSAFSEVPAATLLKANAWAMAWGVANALFGICLMRIGFSLTLGILTGIGLPLGVVIPMVFKGSGAFAAAPPLISFPGLSLLAGTVLILGAVGLIAVAGFGRDKSSAARGGSFKGGLAMAIAMGFLQTGLSFSFVYAQGPVVDALLLHGASESAANAGVWAIVLPGGVLVNVSYPLFLILKRRSWGIFAESPFEFAASLSIGLMFFIMIMSLGFGMRELGALGASIGFGLSQGLQILSSQVVGLLGGEWRGAGTKPKAQMATAVASMLVGVCLMVAARGIAS